MQPIRASGTWRAVTALSLLVALLLLPGVAAPPEAEARIALEKVKRLNKAHVRDEQCFETCLSWSVGSCRRTTPNRARCKATVVFSIHDQASRCRITNRWQQDGRRVEIYEISKRCEPA